jgi:hypothetical protein
VSNSVSIRGIRYFVLLAAAVCLFGCDSGPRFYAVRGKVVIKGKGSVKDLTGYIVQCQSAADPADMPGGVLAEDGTFTLSTRVGGKEVLGAKVGTYHVRLMPQPVEGNPSPPLVIPRRYTKFDAANLSFEVKPGANEVTLDVDRDAR